MMNYFVYDHLGLKLFQLTLTYIKLIGSRFRVQGLPAFGGAEGDQGSKVTIAEP